MTGFKYPSWDTELRRVEHQVTSVWRAAERCRALNVAIQAGGGVGVWPVELAKQFRKVYTFEPDPANFSCLMDNVAAHGVTRKVYAFNVGLWDSNSAGALHRTTAEITNAGAGYIEVDAKGPVTLVPLGAYLRPEVVIDFVQLDVEGAEERALRGMLHWLERDKPVVVLEEKQLGIGHDPLAGRQLLHSLGYRPFGKSGRDTFYAC